MLEKKGKVPKKHFNYGSKCMKTRFCLVFVLLLFLRLNCAAEQMPDPTSFTLKADEQLELSDDYQHVQSVYLGKEAVLNIMKDASLTLDEGAVITLEEKSVINIHGALYGQSADISMGEESEINAFDEQLELSDDYQHVQSVHLGREDVLNSINDG